MKNLLFTLFFASIVCAQQTSQKGNLLVGFEAGPNIAYNSPYNTLSEQGGAAGEYFFAKQWSVAAKAKYNRANLNYNDDVAVSTTSTSGMGFFDFSSPPKKLDYESNNVMLPINIKWNYRIFRTLYGSINFGPYINFKLNSWWYAENIDIRDRKISVGSDLGAGFHYEFQNGNQLSANYDFYRGAGICKLTSFIFDTYARPCNHHISVGYLWRLKSRKN